MSSYNAVGNVKMRVVRVTTILQSCAEYCGWIIENMSDWRIILTTDNVCQDQLRKHNSALCLHQSSRILSSNDKMFTEHIQILIDQRMAFIIYLEIAFDIYLP